MHSDNTKNIESISHAKHNGAGMDRVVSKKKFSVQNLKLPIAIGLIAVAGLAFSTLSNSGRALSVDQSKIVISSVERGTFEDFIPLRGRIIPAKTVFLDAIEGGRVEEILVEDGALLQSGTPIVRLSNASLQLNVLGNEARVAEQLNSMRSIELSLEQNRLQHKRNLADINYQIKMLTRQLQREETLLATNSIMQSKYDDTKDTLDWYKEQKELTLESQASDTRMQESQMTFLRETSKRLEGNLALSRQNLENMNVKAPVDGKLSGFNIEIGQSIGRGERLGQIDTPNDFKVTALIDEFYLSRVDIGQQATFNDYQLSISKIYPQVNNGQFEVDLAFTSQQPSDIRRGQTIQTKLTLGDATSALLIPNGAFYQETGGNWVFVLSADGETAVRRNVKLGRRNSRFIEVVEGLEQGERVITSPYTSYQDMQILNLNS